MLPSEVLRELHEGNQRLQRILDRLHLTELRSWMLTDAEAAALEQLSNDDVKDRGNAEWTR